MKNTLPIIIALAISPFAYADDKDAGHHPIYMGVETGYGSTTWGYLVSTADVSPEEQEIIHLSTPTAVNEGGAIWGLLMGYEFGPSFAIEGSYTHYPNANVHFGYESFFAFDHDDVTKFTTESESVSIIGKFMLPIPHTNIRALSSVGIANVHREDMMFDSWTLSPKFGFGFNFDLNRHVMLEVGINYTAGYAITELTPADDFIPFLYSGYVHLNWRF